MARALGFAVITLLLAGACDPAVECGEPPPGREALCASPKLLSVTVEGERRCLGHQAEAVPCELRLAVGEPSNIAVKSIGDATIQIESDATAATLDPGDELLFG